MFRRRADYDSDGDGYCADVTVDLADHTRVSGLLGPDGEVLRVSYGRPVAGFDLTPRRKPAAKPRRQTAASTHFKEY